VGLMTSAPVLGARSLLRRIGAGNLMMRLQRRGGFEVAMTEGMRRATQSGDVVWDIGANIGEYTVKFAEWVGPSGSVFAFEPARETVGRLRDGTRDCLNVTVIPAALSDRAGRGGVVRDESANGTTFRISTESGGAGEVELLTGDDAIAAGRATLPNVVKIDVEGHELEVLLGMRQALRNPELRHVFVEVHFFIFAEQGRNDAPGRLERLLTEAGLRITWIDASHIRASRVPPGDRPRTDRS
jgi:FkbM family methyltransferase